MKRITISLQLLALLALLVAPAAVSAASGFSWPRVFTTDTPYFSMQNKDAIDAALIINPPTAGCTAELPGAITLTLRYDDQQSIGRLTPCGNTTRLPVLCGLILRRALPKDAESGGVEIGLLPQLSHSNYARTVSLTATMNGRTLVHRNIRVSMIWSASLRVWQDTDDFVNYCIDKARTVYSSNLRLFCIMPATLLGEVRAG